MVIPKLENALGMEVYATVSEGIGGTIKREVEDFVVEEVLVDGSKARVNGFEGVGEKAVLGSSSVASGYLLCVLVKRGYDTFIAVGKVARQLGISPLRIRIAGIKDARAVTGQYVAISGVSVDDVKRVSLKDIRLVPVGYLRSEFSTFYLFGNCFHVAVKDVRGSEAKVERRVRRIVGEMDALGGVPNFFGHQRFGTSRPITHLVGRALVRGSLREAVMLFLAKSSIHEHPDSRRARVELWRSQDFGKALVDFPRQLRFERLMLRSLVEKPDDFAAAFRRLPVRLRGIFVQAYQSFLFNRFLSGRMKRGFGLGVAEVGDFVVGLERSGLPLPAVCKMVSEGNVGEVNRSMSEGRVRVAVPLIGFRQGASGGVQGDVEREILEEEGVSPRDFRVDAMPELGSKGALRAIVSPVKDLSFEYVLEGEGDSCEPRLRMDFMLQRGAYATVVLRELMKPRNPLAAGF